MTFTVSLFQNEISDSMYFTFLNKILKKLLHDFVGAFLTIFETQHLTRLFL